MLHTIVIDANVFMHSENPTVPQQAAAKLLLSKLVNNSTSLCVDDGFDLDESKNTSTIGHEYLTHVRHVEPAFAIIVKLGMSGRILRISRSVNETVGRHILRYVRDKSDRIYAKVAYNSRSRVLATHDSAAYPEQCKCDLRKRIGVHIVDAASACNL